MGASTTAAKTFSGSSGNIDQFSAVLALLAGAFVIASLAAVVYFVVRSLSVEEDDLPTLRSASASLLEPSSTSLSSSASLVRSASQRLFKRQKSTMVKGDNDNSRLSAVLDGSAPDDVDITPAAPTASAQSTLKRARAEDGTIICVECDDQPATVYCDACLDPYCSLCFRAQHKKGRRRGHTWRKAADLRNEDREVLAGDTVIAAGELPELPSSAPAPRAVVPSTSDAMDASPLPDEVALPDDDELTAAASAATTALSENMLERAKYVPMRLSLAERKVLRLVEAGLRVSEYTDKIDILTYTSKTKRIHAQIKEICAILCGLTVASDYQRGQELMQERDFAPNESFFQALFEIARRHKILNPEKMRSEYGKMMYLLMDSASPEVTDLLRFSLVGPLQTVYTTLEAAGALELLRDPLIHVATQDITAAPDTPRAVIRQRVQQKERAVQQLTARFASSTLSRDDVARCLYSLGDNSSYLSFNRDPVDKVIWYLKTYFDPETISPGLSLAISSGKEGARLSHNHRTQYHFVHQSLSLWRETLHHMFQLWYLAETDMLSPDNGYSLRDTGQGLNRLQHSPRVSRMMHTILHRTQQKLGEWVGSSVIHLGDHNVPNALMFIDKYTQISRILNPIVITLQYVELVAPKDEHLVRFLNEAFGGAQNAIRYILADFFRHAFDGSGADNFFDAGSCIDGRLTSAWNWCSVLDKKPYAPLFRLAGFNGFDGDFQN